MQLEELLPSKPVFKLSVTGKEYALRIPSMQDKVDFVQIAGSKDKLTDALKESDWSVIGKLTYMLLEDKSDFKAEKKVVIDNEGIESEKFISGPTKFLQSIVNTTEIVSVLTAFGLAITLSDPVATAMAKEDAEKKRLLLRQ